MSCNYTEGLTLVTNHAEILCMFGICDVDTCCTERASCTDFVCEDREVYVDKNPQESSLCHGVTCSTDWNSPDWNNCCLEKETCKNDDRTYICPEKHEIVDDPTNVHCTNLTCSSPLDDPICCLRSTVSTPGGSSDSGLSVGAIIGIVVGALVVIAVIAVLIFKSRPKSL